LADTTPGTALAHRTPATGPLSVRPAASVAVRPAADLRRGAAVGLAGPDLPRNHGSIGERRHRALADGFAGPDLARDHSSLREHHHPAPPTGPPDRTSPATTAHLANTTTGAGGGEEAGGKLTTTESGRASTRPSKPAASGQYRTRRAIRPAPVGTVAVKFSVRNR
jgi:hypothetical protein